MRLYEITFKIDHYFAGDFEGSDTEVVLVGEVTDYGDPPYRLDDIIAQAEKQVGEILGDVAVVKSLAVSEDRKVIILPRNNKQAP